LKKYFDKIIKVIKIILFILLFYIIMNKYFKYLLYILSFCFITISFNLGGAGATVSENPYSDRFNFFINSRMEDLVEIIEQEQDTRTSSEFVLLLENLYVSFI